MAQLSELCRRCGSVIPAGKHGNCPGCGLGVEATPSLAARQVTGLALPTRSVHALPNTPPRPERPPRTAGPARGARSAFDYTSLFVLLALLGAGLGWVARLDRYVFALPRGIADRIDHLTVLATWASVIGLGIGILALGPWAIRHLRAGATRRHEHDDLLG